jgi:hypothetical protein
MLTSSDAEGVAAGLPRAHAMLSATAWHRWARAQLRTATAFGAREAHEVMTDFVVPGSGVTATDLSGFGRNLAAAAAVLRLGTEGDPMPLDGHAGSNSLGDEADPTPSRRHGRLYRGHHGDGPICIMAASAPIIDGGMGSLRLLSVSRCSGAGTATSTASLSGGLLFGFGERRARDQAIKDEFPPSISEPSIHPTPRFNKLGSFVEPFLNHLSDIVAVAATAPVAGTEVCPKIFGSVEMRSESVPANTEGTSKKLLLPVRNVLQQRFDQPHDLGQCYELIAQGLKASTNFSEECARPPVGVDAYADSDHMMDIEVLPPPATCDRCSN